jgi:HEAT repeat protein
LTAGLLLGGLVLFFTSRNHEPRYKATRLSTWIQRHRNRILQASDSPGTDESAFAIKQIGTNALPYLLTWIQHKETPGHRRWLATLRSLPLILVMNPLGERIARDHDEERAYDAMVAFGALGSEAASSAIPALTEMMNRPDRSEEDVAGRAIFALASLGDITVPILVNALAKPVFHYKRAVAELLGDERFPKLNPSARVPSLLKALDDPDIAVYEAAARSLGNLAVQPETVVPALQKMLENPSTFSVEPIEALGKFGAAARPAVPILIKSLSSQYPGAAEAAKDALRRIGP